MKKKKEKTLKYGTCVFMYTYFKRAASNFGKNCLEKRLG